MEADFAPRFNHNHHHHHHVQHQQNQNLNKGTGAGSLLGKLKPAKVKTPGNQQGLRLATPTMALIKSSSTNLICAICFGINGRACQGCYSVAYCSREHQIQHWGIHRQACRPLVTLQKEEVIRNLSTPGEGKGKDPYLGMYKAARPLKPKDTVLQLLPIMYVAYNKGLPLPPDAILCLGCSKWYPCNQSYRCSKCRWPVCSEKCEMDSFHAKYECKIFYAKSVYPLVNPSNYNGDIVLALRCLMLRESNPSDWEQLVALQPVVEQMVRPRHCLEADEKVAKYLVYNCQIQDLLGFTFPDVMSILKVIDLCSVYLPERGGMWDNQQFSYVSVKYVFPTKVFVGEECSPNCNWSLWHSQRLEECSIRLRASAAIQPGQYITASFSGIEDYGATFSRRYDRCRFLYKCKCRRCSDPTECGTFFSGVKCSVCDDFEKGYLLPEDPLESNCIWRCHNPSCEGTKSGSEISSEIGRIYDEIAEHSNSLQNLLGLIKTNEKVKLHPNHYLIMKATQLSIDLCWGVLQNSILPHVTSSLLEKAKALTDKLANIYKTLHHWNSLPNAMLLFHYQMLHGVARVRQLLWLYQQDKSNKPVAKHLLFPNEFWDLVKIQKVAVDVLITEPFGSIEREKAVILKGVMEDTESLLVLERRDSKIQYETLMGLQKVYSRFCSSYLYSMLPVFEDKELNELLVFTGPYCKDLDDGSQALPLT